MLVWILLGLTLAGAAFMVLFESEGRWRRFTIFVLVVLGLALLGFLIAMVLMSIGMQTASA
ncbi:MAG: hypothetical protein ACP5DX_15650 [Paracoccaceae bacterium]